MEVLIEYANPGAVLFAAHLQWLRVHASNSEHLEHDSSSVHDWSQLDKEGCLVSCSVEALVVKRLEKSKHVVGFDTLPVAVAAEQEHAHDFLPCTELVEVELGYTLVARRLQGGANGFGVLN